MNERINEKNLEEGMIRHIDKRNVTKKLSLTSTPSNLTLILQKHYGSLGRKGEKM